MVQRLVFFPICLVLALTFSTLTLTGHPAVAGEEEDFSLPECVIELLEPFRGKMPGTFGVLFNFGLTEASRARLVSTDASLYLFQADIGGPPYAYYIFPPEVSRASFLGIRSMAGDDTVGIAISGNTFYWVVDNSNFNGCLTIWMRPFFPEEYALVRRADFLPEFKHGIAALVDTLPHRTICP